MQRTIKMFDKTITPAYETIGKRRKLTGFIGALLDGDTVIHSMEYSTNSQAEHALNTLTHELLMDQFEHGLVDDPPTDAPGDDCPDHGPHADDDCPKCGPMLMPEGDWLDVEGLRVVAPGGMVVVQVANEAPTPLLDDCYQVISMALGRMDGAQSVVSELKRIKLRLEFEQA